MSGLPDRPRATHILYMTRAEYDRVMVRSEELAGVRFGQMIEGPDVDVLIAVIREQLDVIVADVVFGIQVVDIVPKPRFQRITP